jgi:hypothetical protein
VTQVRAKRRPPNRAFSAITWDTWRAANPDRTLRSPRWYDPGGKKGRNRFDFSGADLSGLEIYRAFAEGIHLRGTIFEGTHFEEGDFSRADFSGAKFRNTKFNKTILTGANFDGATFVNCNLNRVMLAGASFAVCEITETVVYGIAAWDLNIPPGTKQSKLVFDKSYELYSDIVARGTSPLEVDNIELAQLMYYLTDHKRMRQMLNLLNSKGVLLLGRFRDDGLAGLYKIRDRLKQRGYMGLIFDFDRPDGLDFLEVVVTMAGLSRFVIADLSGPNVGRELGAIASAFARPILVIGGNSLELRELAGQPRIVRIDRDTEIEGKLEEMERLFSAQTAALAARGEPEAFEQARRTGRHEGVK